MQNPRNNMVVDSSFNWISVFLPIVYVGAIAYFGFQTWELVDHLFPAEQLLMKISSVLCFDFMAAVWLSVKMFAKFNVWQNYGLAVGMWRITFGLATAASAIEMYLQAVSFTFGGVDTRIVWTAYAMVVVAAVVNIVALGHFINTEWDAVHPRKFVDGSHSGNVYQVHSSRNLDVFQIQQPVQTKEEISLEQTATYPQPPAPIMPSARADKGRVGRKNSDDAYARLWLQWQDSGFSDSDSPWKKPAAYRTRYPKQDAIDRVIAERK